MKSPNVSRQHVTKARSDFILERAFMFATGIENSYPTIRGEDGKTKRVDEMAKCFHYERWRETVT